MEKRTSSVPEPSAGILLTPRMICKLLSISRQTLRYWVNQGMLPQPLRLGPDGRTLPWHPADLVDYLKRTRGQAAARAALPGLPHDGGPEERRP
jgi:predicted DNA-binding transcriptional regulator AlpA